MPEQPSFIDDKTDTAQRSYGHFIKHLALQVVIFYLLIVAAGWLWSLALQPNEFAGLGLVISLLFAHFLLIVLVPAYYYLYQKNKPFVNGIYASLALIAVGALLLFLIGL